MTDNRLEIARAAALEVGAQLREGAGRPRQVQQKGSPDDLVTEYDFLSEELILQAIKAQFPEDAIVSEEGGGSSDPAEYTWFIDPIDGTTNFAYGLPLYTISMGCYRNGEPYLGLVYDPSHDELFEAGAGEGARLNGEKIEVSTSNTIETSLLATDFPPSATADLAALIEQTRVFQERARDVRRLGSAALHLAYVAVGRLDGYYEFPLASWDWAAGAMIVYEAGGRVTDLHGNWSQGPDRREIVASNGLIHDEMLALLLSVRREGS